MSSSWPWKIVAHRGASAAAPENTLAAFELGFEQGADFIEGDFRLTADDEIVCIHDEDTARVAPDGPPMKVREVTLAELREVDVGRHRGDVFRGASVPTLAEVLEIVPDGKGIYIEIKDPAVVDRLVPAIETSGCSLDRIVVISFYPSVVERFKRTMPSIRTIWVYWWYADDVTGEPSNSADEILEVARNTGADGLSVNPCSWVDGEFVRRLRQDGLEFHTYTINVAELPHATRLLALGVDSITTNEPEALRQRLEELYEPRRGDSRIDESLKVRSDGVFEFLPERPKRRP